MRDFGGLDDRTPRRVVRPRDVRDIAAAGAGAVARGCGHSTDGASLTDGTLIDMRGLAAVHDVLPGRVLVDAGATWREVLDATLPHGLTPPVLTDLLDLTVGGTLSAGGFGGTSHRYGTQADHVLELEVVTRAGEIVTCSPERRTEVFDAVRGGRGRHGIITRAALRLVQAPERVAVASGLCPGVGEMLDLQRTVRADHISGQARPAPAGTGWTFGVKAVLHDRGAAPPGASDAEELSYLDYVDRMRPDVEELTANGEWARPHPWEIVLLPRAHAAAVIEATLAETGPADLGLSGVVLIEPVTVGHVPMLPAPADPVLFGLLRTASPGCAPAEEMQAANRVLLARARAAGGTRYPAS